MVNRVLLMVIDSVGVGHMPDADRFNDDQANTLLHIFRERGRLEIPNLCSLGIGLIVDVDCRQEGAIGCYGKMGERSPNKDTTTGHWELAGVVLDSPFPTYPHGFPRDIIKEFEERIGTQILGNYPHSGTEILEELGADHVETGYPIVYTSADSVFQIAAHEDIVPRVKLYEYCQIARSILTGQHAVARVIARPFRGSPGKFERDNASRKDFSLAPPDETLLDMLRKEGFFVVGVGKIGDIFGHRGLTEEIHTDNNRDGIDRTLESMKKYRNRRGLVFVNLVDFDTVYGHRRNVEGYARALEDLDRRIPQLMDTLSKEDVLIITADHGCDPTHGAHTDHTREYVPLLLYGEMLKKNVSLGTRTTFADCGQTIADMLGARKLKHGKSFKGEVIVASENYQGR
jgi:phosphopentomutase